MRSNYKKLGPYIRVINEKNKDLEVDTLLGVSIQKCFMPSIANTVGTDMSKYKIVRKNQFAYGPVTSRNGDKISVALLQDQDAAIISQAYVVFESIDHNELDPEYLMMWFRRPEFDRFARFMSHGSARETFDWEEMCDVELPIPSIEKQRAIVAEYNTVVNRIQLNERLNDKLEETAQAIYKHWFVDFEFPDEKGEPYKSAGGKMVYNEELDKEIPEGFKCLELDNLLLERNQGVNTTTENVKYTDKGITVLRAKNVLRSQIDYSDVVYTDSETFRRMRHQCKPKYGDILYTNIGTIGNAVLYQSTEETLIAWNVLRMQVDTSIIFADYILQYLKNDENDKMIKSNNSSSTVPFVSGTVLGSIKICIPDAEVQSRCKLKFNTISSYQWEIQRLISSLNELKDVLLSKMSKVEETTEKEIKIS